MKNIRTTRFQTQRTLYNISKIEAFEDFLKWTSEDFFETLYSDIRKTGRLIRGFSIDVIHPRKSKRPRTDPRRLALTIGTMFEREKTRQDTADEASSG